MAPCIDADNRTLTTLVVCLVCLNNNIFLIPLRHIFDITSTLAIPVIIRPEINIRRRRRKILTVISRNLHRKIISILRVIKHIIILAAKPLIQRIHHRRLSIIILCHSDFRINIRCRHTIWLSRSNLHIHKIPCIICIQNRRNLKQKTVIHNQHSLLFSPHLPACRICKFSLYDNMVPLAFIAQLPGIKSIFILPIPHLHSLTDLPRKLAQRININL